MNNKLLFVLIVITPLKADMCRNFRQFPADYQTQEELFDAYIDQLARQYGQNDEDDEEDFIQDFIDIMERIVTYNQAQESELLADLELLHDILEQDPTLGTLVFSSHGTEYLPLFFALEHRNMRLLQELLPYANFYAEYAGENAFDYLIGHFGNDLAFTQAALDILETAQNYDINMPNFAGRTPLIQAIYENNLDLVDELLTRGALPNEVELWQEDGRHPLLTAQDLQQADGINRSAIIEVLLDHEDIEIPAGFRRNTDDDNNNNKKARTE